MSRIELAELYGEKVRIICTDGKEIIGIFHSFINAADNEPEKDEMGIKTETMGLQGIYLDEIHSITAI
jgi:hypothetical protein